jgi:hypothetical protein
MRMKLRRVPNCMGAPLTLLLLVPMVASASPILNGTFNLAGTFSVTGFSLIHWQSNDSPPMANEATVGTTGLTGSFASLAPGGENVTINDLINPPEIVDSAGFSPEPFVTFTTMPTWATLLIDFIPEAPVLDPSGNCPSGAPKVGQTCTLSGSPFNLTNISGTVTHPIGTQVGFVLDGVTSDGKSDWTANYTAQFNVPYQTLLGVLFPSSGPPPGTVTNTFSATFTLAPAPSVPESSTGGYMVIGSLALFLGLYLRRRPSERA